MLNALCLSQSHFDAWFKKDEESTFTQTTTMYSADILAQSVAMTLSPLCLRTTWTLEILYLPISLKSSFLGTVHFSNGMLALSNATFPRWIPSIIPSRYTI